LKVGFAQRLGDAVANRRLEERSTGPLPLLLLPPNAETGDCRSNEKSIPGAALFSSREKSELAARERSARSAGFGAGRDIVEVGVERKLMKRKR